MMKKKTIGFLALTLLLCCSVAVFAVNAAKVTADKPPTPDKISAPSKIAPTSPVITAEKRAATKYQAPVPTVSDLGSTTNVGSATLAEPAVSGAVESPFGPEATSNIGPVDHLSQMKSALRRVENGAALPGDKELVEEYMLNYRTRPGSVNPLDDTGGPDAFGYRFVDNLGDSATYEWIELRGDPGATWIAAWDSYDDGCASASHPIGFNFPFYGGGYANFTPTSNGAIEFGVCTPYSYYSCLPNTAYPETIFPFLYDLHLQRGGDVSGNLVVGYKNFGSYTVIEYDSIGFYSTTYAGSSLKFEVILFDDGRIKIQYNNMVYNAGAIMGTVGIQNNVGAISLQYRCYTDLNTFRPLDNGRAIWFYLGAAELGRCCYGDPGNPSCADNYPADCAALGGTWTYGLACATDPCPIFRPCEAMTPEDELLDPIPTNPWEGMVTGDCGNFGKWVGSFTATALTNYHFDLCPDAPGNGSNNFDVDIKICDAAGNILAGQDGSCVAWSWAPNDFVWQAPSAGTYYVVLAPYFSYTSHTCTGTSNDTFTMYYYASEPILVECPPGATLENEPVCADEYVDVTNGGCNSTPYVFQTINCGETICGESGTFLFGGNNYRDTDWFEFTLASPMTVTWSVVADFPVLIFTISPPCLGTIRLSATAGPNVEATIVDNMLAGTYWVWVGPSAFTGVPCGTDWVGTLTCDPWEPIGRCCYGDPGAPSCADITESECAALAGSWTYGVSCASNPCPVQLECPPGGILEGEPACADEYVDAYNGGCNSTPNIFQTIDCGDVICGKSGTYLFGGSNYRDTDWFELTLAAPMTVTWSAISEFDLLIFTINPPCPGGIRWSATAPPNGTATIVDNMYAGTYYLWVGPSVFSGIPCESDYIATLTCEPWTPPTGRCCYDYPALCAVNTEPECDALGGNWTEGLDCSTPCPECVDFEVIAPVLVTGNTCGAGDDVGIVVGAEDQVYLITIPYQAQWQIQLCDETVLFWDSYMCLGTSCGGTEIWCQDDGGCGPLNYYLSKFPCLDLAPGDYFLTIEGLYAGQCGEYTLSVQDCGALPGRCCYNEPVECAVTTEGECDALGGAWDEGLTCDTPCPVRPPCPEDPIFSQRSYLPEELWNFITTDEGSPGYRVYDNYTVTEAIGGVRVFGLRLFFSGGWAPCAEDPMTFSIKFFNDNGSGQPDESITECEFMAVAPAVTTGIFYGGVYELFYWDLAFTGACPLQSGWIMVAGAGDPNCWFLWSASPEGDANAWQLQPPTYVQLNTDLSFCLISGQCDPATDVTVYRELNVADEVNVRFWAPADGNYLVYKTTEPNNDGDPDNGADPDWSLMTTVAAVAGYNSVDDLPLVPYANYVVVHDCTPPVPMGRCCYGDINDPDCLSPATFEDCEALFGTWTFGLNCVDDPCPLPNPGEWCENAIPFAVPGQVAGTTAGYVHDYDAVCPYTGSTSSDVVYSYTPTVSEQVTFTLCLGTTDYDTKLYIYANDCVNGTEIACNDDDCTAPNFPSAYVSYLECVPLTAGTTYYIVVDGYGGGNGNYTLDATVCAGGQYCAASHDFCDEYIGNVTVGTINNTTDCTAGGYNDYTATSTNMTILTGYPITVTNPVPYTTDATGVWVDWNNNFSFADAGEYTLLTNDGTGASFTGTITPPAGATLGAVRMRVRLGYSWTPAPCGATSYGETEDYTVIVE